MVTAQAVVDEQADAHTESTNTGSNRAPTGMWVYITAAATATYAGGLFLYDKTPNHPRLPDPARDSITAPSSAFGLTIPYGRRTRIQLGKRLIPLHRAYSVTFG